ncbi:hypothetical protein BHM03_00062710, partial [Ensete ventricosum]
MVVAMVQWSRLSKTLYRPVHTGSAADRYADRPLSGDSTKIGRRWSISVIYGQFKEKLTVSGRLRKKKERRRRGEEEEEVPRAALAATPPGGSPVSRRRPCCPSAVAVRGREFEA